MQKAVTFIVICYKEYWEAYMFCASMLLQKNPNWKCIIWHDGPNEELKTIIDSFNDTRFTYIANEENLGSWGAFNRIKALEMVDTEYVIQTTLQEYYIPITVDKILESKNDFIYWNTIHHSFGYRILNSYPKITFIDWSNFAVKTKIAQSVGINHPKEYCCDGMYVEDLMNSGLIKSQIKLPLILNIKN